MQFFFAYSQTNPSPDTVHRCSFRVPYTQVLSITAFSKLYAQLESTFLSTRHECTIVSARDNQRTKHLRTHAKIIRDPRVNVPRYVDTSNLGQVKLTHGKTFLKSIPLDDNLSFASSAFEPLNRTRLNKALPLRSRLKGMPQKDLINIRNYDVRHLIPKVCSAVLKNGPEILIESIVK